ncbi:hypothetical protein BV898_00534 [Hypsibius exemplaris]|uniref:G-protein coupled receptors family 1 profile domain-containing protein n=1 Tax=Hypsibius exemplaris TaxID=2072580 RepID=A0A1W0XDV4_HYPEX|nr:hypothetical protein BV898_00534 [Hypsibius exemplaris]
MANHTEYTEYSADFTRLLAALPYIFILICIATLLFNCVVLAAFTKNSNLRTPFNVYIISLVIANLLQACFDLPFTVYSELHPSWELGRIGCNFYLYAKWTFSAAVRNTHSVISLNRIWALFFPISYRHYHTRSMAIWLCLGSWLYVHIFLLPGLVMDAQFYRVDDGSCQVNTTSQRAWALPTQIVLYNSSVFIVGVSYPIIWLKVRERRKIDARRNTIHTKTNTIEMKTRVGGPISNVTALASVEGRKSDRNSNSLSTKKPNQLHGDSDNSDDTEGVQATNGQDPGGLTESLKLKKPSQSFAVLTYLVIGVVFCWTPIMVYYTMAIITDYNNYVHFIIGTLLYNFNSVLDPIFFTMAMAPLRATIFHFLSPG